MDNSPFNVFANLLARTSNKRTVRFDERGDSGRPVLILHGGGGPQTVAGLAAGLSKAHVLVPTHPGFAGEPRPEWFNSIDDLALTSLNC